MAAKQEMIKWFRSRYESERESLHHEGRGNYAFPPGVHPVDVKSVLEEQFAGSDPEEIEAAVTQLESAGPWVDMQSYDEAE